MAGTAPQTDVPLVRWPAWAPAAVALPAAALVIVPAPGWVLDALTALSWIAAAALPAAWAAGLGREAAARLPVLLPATGLLRLLLLLAAVRSLADDGSAGMVAALLGGGAGGAGPWAAAVALGGLVLLQTTVIARGAERSAEVAARFALDALPGLQMSIDADLRAGAIDAAEAGRRRSALDARARLAGALDGAVRFLRGEAGALPAVAGLGYLAAVASAVTVRGEPVLAAAADAAAGVLGAALAAAVPAVLAGLGATLLIASDAPAEPPPAAGDSELPPPLALELGSALAAGFAPPAARARLDALTGELFRSTGVRFPALQPAAPAGLEPDEWRLTARGSPLAGGRSAGPEAAESVLAQLRTVLRRGAAGFVGVQEVRDRLDELERTHPALVREVLSRAAPLPRLAELLRRLAEEAVPLLDLRAILEAVLARAAACPDADRLVEAVRADLRRQLPAVRPGPDGSLAVHLPDPEVESLLREGIRHGGDGAVLVLEPEFRRAVLRGVAAAADDAAGPMVLLTEAAVRPHLRRLLAVDFPDVAVISYAELLPECRVRPVGRVKLLE